MSPHRTTARRAALTLLAGLLPLAVLLGLLPATPAAATDHPVPPLKVTVTKSEEPRYGDPFVFTVRSSGAEVAVVTHGTTELASQPMSGGGTTFRIPTTDRFQAGVEYRLDIEVGNEVSSGTAQVTVKPWFIGSTVTLPTTTISYSAPLFGDLVPTAPTAIDPSGGDMVLRYEGLTRATYPIRTDGTFALRDTTMTPGVYPDVHVFYGGDAAYAQNFFGSGMFIGDLTVVPMPTTTTAALSASVIDRGDPLSVLASARSADANTVADVTGDVVVSAAPAGTSDFAEVARVAYPGGNQALTVPLDDFADTHAGRWTVRVAHSGTGISAPSHQDLDLAIDTPASEPVATTTALRLDRTTTPYGGRVTATATVEAADGAVPGGDVAFLVAGTRVATAPVRADGTAVAVLPAGAPGTRTVTATYLGGPGRTGSTSAPVAVRVAPASSTTTARLTRPKNRRVRLTVQVTSAAPVAGAVVVRLGRKVVARGVLKAASRGRVVLVTGRLPVGKRRLVVSYEGSREVSASRSRAYAVRVR